jgi:hypothetical protein
MSAANMREEASTPLHVLDAILCDALKQRARSRLMKQALQGWRQHTAGESCVLLCTNAHCVCIGGKCPCKLTSIFRWSPWYPSLVASRDGCVIDTPPTDTQALAVPPTPSMLAQWHSLAITKDLQACDASKLDPAGCSRACLLLMLPLTTSMPLMYGLCRAQS